MIGCCLSLVDGRWSTLVLVVVVVVVVAGCWLLEACWLLVEQNTPVLEINIDPAIFGVRRLVPFVAIGHGNAHISWDITLDGSIILFINMK